MNGDRRASGRNKNLTAVGYQRYGLCFGTPIFVYRPPHTTEDFITMANVIMPLHVVY